MGVVSIRQSHPCQWICIHSCSPLLPQHLEQNLTLIRYKISTLSKDEWIHMQSGVVLEMRKYTEWWASCWNLTVGSIKFKVSCVWSSGICLSTTLAFSDFNLNHLGDLYQCVHAHSVGLRWAREGAFCSQTIPMLLSMDHALSSRCLHHSCSVRSDNFLIWWRHMWFCVWKSLPQDRILAPVLVS